MYELKNGKVFTSKFVGTRPSSYKKRIYRAAVSQKLRNTVLSGLFPSDFPTTTLYNFLFSLVHVTCSVCFVPYDLRP